MIIDGHFSEGDIEAALAQLADTYGHDSEALLELGRFLSGEDDVLSRTHNPVSIDQFIHDDYFMGRMIDNIWPSVVKTLTEIIEGRYVEAVLSGAIGIAKCLGRDTPVLRLNGTLVMSQDIQVGEALIGEDSQLREVESIASGWGKLYKIRQDNGMDYVVNEDHILSVKQQGSIYNLSLKGFINGDHSIHECNGWKPASVSFSDETGFIRREYTFGTRSSLSIEYMGQGEFYGIMIKGSERLFLLGDGTVTHNTTIATMVTAYNIYELSCELNPQQKFGLLPNADLTFVMLNKTDSLARDVTYSRFRKLMDGIPYFKENFPYDHAILSKIVWENGMQVLYSAANSAKILGYNVVGGIIDEVNFMENIEKSKRSRTGGSYNQADEIYTGVVRRRKSRFMGSSGLPGCLCVVSSRAFIGDFTDKRIKEIYEEDDGLSYVMDKSQWAMLPAIKPDGSVRFSGETFLVAIGSDKLDSEIIASREHSHDREVIDVPIEFYSDFSKDITGSLMEFAGRVSKSTNSYFYETSYVYNSTHNFDTGKYHKMFNVDQCDLSKGMPPINPSYRLSNPSIYRFLHVDLAISGDSCGIALGHSPSDTVIRTRKSEASYNLEKAPKIIFDMMLGVAPPMNGEIQIADVRRFIYFVRDVVKVPLKYISYDGFQSADSRQILARQGFETQLISVEGELAYSSLRDAYFQERVESCYHEKCFNELISLVQDPKTRRVDHLPTAEGSKDIADGQAGVLMNISKKYEEGDLYRKTNVMRGMYTNDPDNPPSPRRSPAQAHSRKRPSRYN